MPFLAIFDGDGGGYYDSLGMIPGNDVVLRCGYY
jgi:hypothetical protein